MKTEQKPLPTVESLKIPVMIDAKNQVITTLNVAANNKQLDVVFKIDNGCNAVLMWRDSLKDLGFDVSQAALNKLPEIGATLGDGSVVNFRQIGEVVLIHKNCKICSVPVVCHTSKNTRNLLGTSVLHKFGSYMINTRGKTFLTLTSQ
jgi:hypothetical protein